MATTEGELAPEAARGVSIARGARAAALDASPGWRRFHARHRGWKAQWNERTGTPHRAYGPGIVLDTAIRDSAGVDQAVRAFVAGHPELFGTPALATAGALRGGAWWYVRYRQTVEGLPVLFSDWEFRVHSSGRLAAFGADARTLRGDEHAAPRVARFEARTAAARGVPYRPEHDTIVDGGLAWLPWTDAAGARLRLVYEQEVITADPPGRWLTYVDAGSGEALWRMNRVRHGIGGQVTADIHGTLPTHATQKAPLKHLQVFVGPALSVTSAMGRYLAPATGTVTVVDSLMGLYCDVTNAQPFPASFSAAATDPDTLDIHWSDANSDAAQRDAYFHVTLAHDWIRAIDPGFIAIDYPMRARVNVIGNCNAFWDGAGVNFFRAGAGCPNTATMPDVVYHEYAHGINDRLYLQAGARFMFNAALHEGLADVTAAFIQDDPVTGKGFFGPGTSVRSSDNTLRWPDDDDLDPHATGLILAGALWDLREAIDLADAARLTHFARYGAPDDTDDGVAMSEFFLELLIAADDDADLANGSPHFAEIVAAFNAHGIGTGFFIDFYHTPLADQPGPGPYPVAAAVVFDGPVGALDPTSPTLHWSANGAPFVAVPMTPNGNLNEYAATIPGQAAAIVRYYVAVSDVHGGERTEPAVAPGRHVHSFVAGPAVTLLLHDMESSAGWSSGAPGDDATAGRWERVNPNGTLINFVNIQPEDDHSPGTKVVCWITGQTPLDHMSEPGFSDVDGGRTTLFSPVFDALAGGGRYPAIEYWRWFTNQYGSAPGTDPWRTYLSNDAGLTWALVEDTVEPENAWRRVLFFIEDVMPATSTMRMKFVAMDSAVASLVEAGVDDFKVLAFPAGTVGAGGPVATAASLELAPAVPNPMRSGATFHLALPTSGRATLRVFDVHGRAVRTLLDATRSAGPHAVEWDGRDDRGVRVASGPYFVRLSHAAREALQKVLRVE